MRVAMVASDVSPAGAGIASSVEGLSRHVNNEGAQVRIFALQTSSDNVACSNWTGAPVTLSRIVGPTALGYAPGMLKEILAWNPDVVHLHGLWMHPSRTVVQWAQRTSRPYLISPHGMLAPAALAFSSKKKRVAGILFQDRAMALASAFHAASDQERAQIREFGLGQPVEQFPFGMEPLDLPPTTTAERKTVLSLGRLHPVKGLDVLLRAWAIIEPRHPQWNLDIVGPDDDGYQDVLEALIAKLGLKRVKIAGPLYGEDKFQRLAEASIFVLPSHSENFGLTVVESLMMGTPVIAAEGTPWAKLDEAGCGFWVPQSEVSLATAIERSLNLTKQQRTAMGLRGRDWVLSTFVWPKIASKALDAYRGIVASRAS